MLTELQCYFEITTPYSQQQYCLDNPSTILVGDIIGVRLHTSAACELVICSNITGTGYRTWVKNSLPDSKSAGT